MAMKARVQYVCQPKSKRANYDAEDIVLDVTLPFLPPIGSKLKLTKNGDYLKVDDIYLDFVGDEEKIVIFIEEPDELDALRPWKEMKAEGWRLDRN